MTSPSPGAGAQADVYLSVPFVLSWSLLDALSSGCVVLAGDVPPVREVIEPGRTGLVEPLFDADRLAGTALRVLEDPAAFRHPAAGAPFRRQHANHPARGSPETAE